jgi:hypothetical protein
MAACCGLYPRIAWRVTLMVDLIFSACDFARRQPPLLRRFP